MKKYSSIFIALLGVVIGILGVLTVQKCFDQRKRLKSEYQDWRKLHLVLKCIDENYVDTIDIKKVSDDAIAAALSALDPHSVYMLPQELEDSNSDLMGNFDGIGIQFNVPNDTAVVMEVIPGGPSEKIGIQTGDRILKVDSIVIAGVKYEQDSMVRHMRGPSGSKVTITVKRGGETIPFEITRGKIPTHSIAASFMVSDTTAYIRLSKFSATTYKEFLEISSKLSDAGMKHLILDIRGNTGGFLDQALMLSNSFLHKGEKIVYLEGLHRKREDYNADGHGLFQYIGLTVLIDEESASSSEIFAGAMQDNGRAQIVGRRSFGKGLVQEPIYFTDGSGIRLTVARFYTPSGRCIQKPYSDDYHYDIYKRYQNGEMLAADSMKLEYGGIIPDIFVPVDTTRATQFYLDCNKKATPMRYASAFFDSHKELSSIEDYDALLKYLDKAGLESGFLEFARRVDGLYPKADEWTSEREYMMTQVRALVGRYSKLGDNAFYHLYLQVDKTFYCAMKL